MRVVFEDADQNGQPEIIEDNLYYFLGLPISGLDNPYKQQRKEFQEHAFDLNGDFTRNIHLDLYDVHARNYNMHLSRFPIVSLMTCNA